MRAAFCNRTPASQLWTYAIAVRQRRILARAFLLAGLGEFVSASRPKIKGESAFSLAMKPTSAILQPVSVLPAAIRTVRNRLLSA